MRVYLYTIRPTAVNLAWAIDRMLAVIRKTDTKDNIEEFIDIIEKEALTIHEEDATMCHNMGEYGYPLISKCSGLLTHCNAGCLATGGIGTATALFVCKYYRRTSRNVYVRCLCWY